MARTTKSTDETLAALEAEFAGSTAVEKSVEDTQREEATKHVTDTLAAAYAGLKSDAFTGEAKDLIAKAAANLHSALRNAKAAVKKQADPSQLPGVVTTGDTTEGTNAAE